MGKKKIVYIDKQSKNVKYILKTTNFLYEFLIHKNVYKYI